MAGESQNPLKMETSKDNPPEIDRLILLDRECDLVTPCLSQLVYEGMIDEVFGIANSSVQLTLDMVDAKATEEGKKKLVRTPLSSNDALFKELRDANLSVVGPKLQKKAEFVTATYDRRHNAKTMKELKELMGCIQEVQILHHSVTIHTNIAEKVLTMAKDPKFRSRLDCEQALLSSTDKKKCLKYIETLLPPPGAQQTIQKKQPTKAEPKSSIADIIESNKFEAFDILRYACLYSLTCDGLPHNALEYLKREILQKFGFHLYSVIDQLFDLGMLKNPEQPTIPWSVLCEEFNLVVEEVEENSPTDIAYVYSGYAPLSCRLIEKALDVRCPFRRTEETKLLKSTGGYDIYQGWHPEIDSLLNIASGGPTFHSTQAHTARNTKSARKDTVVLLFFVGGCTYAEISACRLIEKLHPGIRIMVATTKIISGKSFLNAFDPLSRHK
eukprot:TRINITY_DN6628_c0_g1_i1.p1 TRINITY_DN6628_c0_g1~~TRINITY_DN6628_c0_g1_i1.p1  ORF type:complete len:442 (-),score=69.46 TRINITY_DN6628_c0_g1_i1:11-1336(-)